MQCAKWETVNITIPKGLTGNKRTRLLTSLLIFLIVPQITWAEPPSVQTGFGIAGLPSLGYSSDEGLKYGANAALYNYAGGGYLPYFYLIQTDVFLMTGSGKKNALLFFDSPHLIPRHRLSAELQYENDVSSPFYGVGSQTIFRKALTDTSSKEFIDTDYYRFGREKLKLTADLQRLVWRRRLRALIGVGVFHTEIAPNTIWASRCTYFVVT